MHHILMKFTAASLSRPRIMDKAPTAQTWASIASTSSSSITQPYHKSNLDRPQRQSTHQSTTEEHHQTPPRYIPSPQHQPQSSTANDTVYVLTLLTNKSHHLRLTSLRKQYFPQQLNKLSAHLTLFHALPGSRLQSTVIPDLQRLAGRTAPFQIRATRPFRMKRGIAIGLARDEQGYKTAQETHKVLQLGWKKEAWLSEQDAQEGWRGHYTIMNKVDDESEVARAFKEVTQDWEDDVGTVEGLGLWRYEKGWWKWERSFEFRETEGGNK